MHGLKPGLDLRRAIEDSFESGLWAEFAEDCVECGACNFICCTCHCFLLADGLDEDGTPARTRLWDACLYKAFARTAAPIHVLCTVRGLSCNRYGPRQRR